MLHEISENQYLVEQYLQGYTSFSQTFGQLLNRGEDFLARKCKAPLEECSTNLSLINLDQMGHSLLMFSYNNRPLLVLQEYIGQHSEERLHHKM